MSISFSFSQASTLQECSRLNEFWGEHPIQNPEKEAHVQLVMRAFARTQREFDAYRAGTSPGGLSAVRKYHRLLCDELDSFSLRFLQGGTRRQPTESNFRDLVGDFGSLVLRVTAQD